MGPPLRHQQKTIEQRVEDIETQILGLQREIENLVRGETGRNEAAEGRLADALAGAVRTFNGMRGEMVAKLDAVLQHSEAADAERKRRRDEEDAAKKAAADAATQSFERSRKNRLAMMRYGWAPIAIAIVGAAATCAGASHITNGPHGAGAETKKAAE